MARSGGNRRDGLDNVGFGIHYGVVTQNQDKDSKVNRIKVRLPWLDGGDKDQTHWAQLMTHMEGDKFGSYCLPDVEDVVAVMFMAGDTSMPVVLGGVWSTPDNSPEPNSDGKNNFRGYRSRSGHRLILDDSGKGKVVIADKSCKLMIGVGEFDKDGDGPNVCEVYSPPMAGKTGMSFSSMEGTFEITCKDGTLKINAEQNIKINAKTTIDIKAGQDIKLDGQTAVKISSTAPSNYDAPQVNIG